MNSATATAEVDRLIGMEILRAVRRPEPNRLHTGLLGGQLFEDLSGQVWLVATEQRNPVSPSSSQYLIDQHRELECTRPTHHADHVACWHHSDRYLWHVHSNELCVERYILVVDGECSERLQKLLDRTSATTRDDNGTWLAIQQSSQSS